MAKRSYGDQNGKDKSAKTGGAVRFDNTVFVNRELSTEEAAALKKEPYDASAMENALEKWCEEYKITFKYDSYNRCCACFMQALDKEHENAGYTLTSRGSSFLKAFKQLMYKHEVLAAGEPWSQWDKNRSFSIDD